jgi:phage terminase large subunit-like protein
MFKRLRLPDVVGTPRFADVGAQWQFDFVEAFFGSYDPDEDRRAITEFFVLVPKKNGKSTLAAGIMVTAVLSGRRPDAEYMFLAPTIEIAGISFRQGAHHSPRSALTQSFHVQDNIRRITNRNNNSFPQIKAADPML